MSERVAIVNQALSWISQDRVGSIEDDSKRARVMKDNYELAKNATLEAHQWKFALKRFIPGALEEAPEWGWDRQFSVPADIMRVVHVAKYPYGAGVNQPEQADYEYEGRRILTNETEIYCKGIRYIEDEGSFSPLFVMALAAHLAMLCAFPLAGSRSLEEKMEKRFGIYTGLAASRDAQQGRTKRVRGRSLSKARRGGYRNY